MTMFDQVVASDLAALGADSAQRITPLVLPAAKIVVAAPPAVRNPARRFANSAAAIAAGIAAIGCGAALSVLPHRSAISSSSMDPPSQPPTMMSVWFLGFAAVALVATAFLTAHRIASAVRVRKVPALAAWRETTRGIGDLAFSVTIIVWITTWFVTTWMRWDTFRMYFGETRILVAKLLWNEARTEPMLVIAGGVAVALTVRCFAVILAHRASDRWRGTSAAVALKLIAITLLVAVFGLCEFEGGDGYTVFWNLPTHWQLSIRSQVFQVMDDAVRYYQPPLTGMQWAGVQLVLEMTAVAILVGLVCLRERHLQAPSRWLRVIEYPAVIPLAIFIGAIALLRQGCSNYEDLVFPPLTTSVAIGVVLVSIGLRRRRSQLAKP